jgi:hypothetical protein
MASLAKILTVPEGRPKGSLDLGPDQESVRPFENAGRGRELWPKDEQNDMMMAVREKLAMTVMNSLATCMPQRIQKLRDNDGNRPDHEKPRLGPTVISRKDGSSHELFDMFSILFDRRSTYLFGNTRNPSAVLAANTCSS